MLLAAVNLTTLRVANSLLAAMTATIQVGENRHPGWPAGGMVLILVGLAWVVLGPGLAPDRGQEELQPRQATRKLGTASSCQHDKGHVTNPKGMPYNSAAPAPVHVNLTNRFTIHSSQGLPLRVLLLELFRWSAAVAWFPVMDHTWAESGADSQLTLSLCSAVCVSVCRCPLLVQVACGCCGMVPCMGQY